MVYVLWIDAEARWFFVFPTKAKARDHAEYLGDKPVKYCSAAGIAKGTYDPETLAEGGAYVIEQTEYFYNGA